MNAPLDTAGLMAPTSASRRAWPWLPAVVREGRIFVGPCGETLIARADGALELVVLGMRPHGGIAEIPTTIRKSA